MFPTDFSFIAKNCFHFLVLPTIFCRFWGVAVCRRDFSERKARKKSPAAFFAAEKEKTKKFIFFWFSSCAGGFYMI